MSEDTNVKTTNLGDAPDPGVKATKPVAGTTVVVEDPVPIQDAPAVVQHEKVALNEKDTDKRARGDHLERPARKCGCACNLNCNCKCSCACRDHCVCRIQPCNGNCGSRVSRNLVISIDGTSNQFGTHNTNVVELHSQILTSENQAKYYNSGIGTYVPPEAKMSLKYLRQQVDNALDLAFALNFKENLLKAYRWLSHTYQTGDKIFFFGFSRGAHQIRALAGMIATVGLVEAGNEDLIPFAYEIYLERHKGEPTDDAKEIAENFKKTFSREVRIHFLGAWDTVSSIGVFHGKPLPLTSSARHICIFRHALALDERRVKFVPEYVDHDTGSVPGAQPVDVKEVWFAGTHSDIGGGIKKNLKLNLSSVPLLWMENEASSAGLRLDRQPTGGAWNMADLKKDDMHESLTTAWQPLEYLPLSWVSFKTSKEVTMTPHRGAGRFIVPGQRIHISVAFKSKGYVPRATFLNNNSIQWESFVGKNIETGNFNWVGQWENQVEMDLFDASFTMEAVQEVQKIWATEEPLENEGDTETKSYWVNRLAFMSLSGQLAANYLSKLKQSSGDNTTKIHAVVELFQKLREKHPGTFDADVAALLDHKASLLFAAKEVDNALDAYRAAETIRLNIARSNKASGQATETLAICIGKLYRPSQLNLSNNALVTIQQVVKRSPRNPNQSLANSLHNVGVILHFLDQNEDAIHADEEAVALRHKLAETDPTITKDLAQSLHNLGAALSALGRHEDALRTEEEAIALWRKLAETDPTMIRNLAWSLINLGVDLNAVGRQEDALRADKEAVTLQRKLSETDPTVTKDLAQSLTNLVVDLRVATRYADAVAVDEEAVALQRKLAETDPTMISDLAWCLNNLGVDLNAVGRQEDALRADEEAVALWHKCAETDPTNTENLAKSLVNLAIDLRIATRHEDAILVIQEAVALWRKLVETDPTVTKDLANSLEILSFRSRAVGRHEAALKAREEAVGLYRKVAETDSTILNYSLPLALQNLSFDLSALNRHEDAVHISQEAVEHYQRVAERTANIELQIASALQSLGACLRNAGHHEDGLRTHERGAEIYQKLEETDPADTADSLHELAGDFRSIGCHEDSLHAEEGVVKLYRKLALKKPPVIKDLIKSLKLLAEDLRALGREEDAARADAEALALQSMASEGPTSDVHTVVQSQSLLAKTPATEAKIDEATENEAETDAAEGSQSLPATMPAINEAKEEAGENETERDNAVESQSLRPVIHGATIEEAVENQAERDTAAEAQSSPDAAETSVHEASTEKLEAGENQAQEDKAGESQSLPADAAVAHTIHETVIEEAGGNETESDGAEEEEEPGIRS